MKYRQVVLLFSSRLARERMYYKRVDPHRGIAQQCELKSVRQPNQWGVKESNYKAAKKTKTDPLEQLQLRPGNLGASDKI